MLAEFQTWRSWPSSPQSEALAAVRAVQGTGLEPRALVGYTTVARMNTYQAQLYRRFPYHGLAVVAVNEPWSFPALANPSMSELPTFVHLHWLSFVCNGATSRQDAEERAEHFLRELDGFVSRGGLVAWTVHNTLPHDTVYRDVEIRVQQAVADASHLVHIMSEATPRAMGGLVDLDPQRTVVVPHPNYRGSYADSTTRVEARLALGIEPDEAVLVLFGAIKPYKGLGQLLEAFDEMRARTARRGRLVVAGAPDGTAAAQAFVEQCTVHPDVLIAPRKIAGDHVQHYLRAADVGLAPYDRVLNSGAVRLYETFGLPVVIPHEAPLLESCADGTYASFTPGDFSGLVEALRDGLALADDVETSGRIEAHVDRLDTDVLSARLAESFAALLAGS